MENANPYHLDRTLMDKNEIPLAQVLRGKEVTNLEYLVKEDGTPSQYQLANGRRMLDKLGEFAGAIMVVNDIDRCFIEQNDKFIPSLTSYQIIGTHTAN
jgi:hypothetical protein